MNLDIMAGCVPSSAVFHLSTISRHPLFELHIEGDPKINFGPDYSHLMSMLYYRKHGTLCFSHLPDYGSSSADWLSQDQAAERDREGASAETLALIRHLRVIRLNTAFTLHSAHSSCSAVALRESTVRTNE